MLGPSDVICLRMKGVDNVQIQIGERRDFFYVLYAFFVVTFRCWQIAIKIISVLRVVDKRFIQLNLVIVDIAVGLAFKRISKIDQLPFQKYDADNRSGQPEELDRFFEDRAPERLTKTA